MSVNNVIGHPLFEKVARMYLHEKKSANEIGAIVGFSDAHIRRILKENGVKMRGSKEAHKLAANKPETKMKMSESAKGRKLSDKAKNKLRERLGCKNHNWRNGLTITSQGYLAFTNSEANGEHAGRMLHQVIAEWKYKRKVKPKEHVHHLDKNRLNNDPNNLVILSDTKHAILHTKDRENGKRS